MTEPIDADSLPVDRAGRLAWIAAAEERIATMVRAALRRVIAQAADAYTGSLTAAGDLTLFDSIPAAWLQVVYDEIAPAVEGIYLSGAATVWVGAEPVRTTASGFARVANAMAESYMRDATNRLAGVGDTTWRMVRNKTESAIRAGASNEALKNAIEDVTGFSEYRADTIARTETNAAYVQGDMAGARALGDDGPVEKVWVAVGDARTREDHADADGQCVRLSERFNVGGEMLDSPHDPSASPGNVVNCRCYVELLYPGDTRPDGSEVPEYERTPGAVTIDDEHDNDA